MFVAVLSATVQMFSIVPKGFIPDQDNDTLFVNLQRGAGHLVLRHGASGRSRSADIVIRNPYVDSFIVQRRRRRRRRRRREQRPHAWCSSCRARSATVTAQQIAQQIRPQLLRFPGFRGFVGLPPALQIGGRMGNRTTTS